LGQEKTKSFHVSKGADLLSDWGSRWEEGGRQELAAFHGTEKGVPTKKGGGLIGGYLKEKGRKPRTKVIEWKVLSWGPYGKETQKKSPEPQEKGVQKGREESLNYIVGQKLKKEG